MIIETIRLNEMAVMPKRETEYSAGADLRACIEEDITIKPQDTYLVPTGLAMAIPEGYAGFIYARSGLASKKGLAPANKVGVIDSDYRGEIKVALFNHSNEDRIITPLERIAQLVIEPVKNPEYIEVHELNNTERGEGGFGSTGTN